MTVTDLVQALERLTSRFAIAVASGSKRTTVDRQRLYLETEWAMRQWVKVFRASEDGGSTVDPDWVRTAEYLRNLPLPSDESGSEDHARILCERLRELMSRFRFLDGPPS